MRRGVAAAGRLQFLGRLVPPATGAYRVSVRAQGPAGAAAFSASAAYVWAEAGGATADAVVLVGSHYGPTAQQTLSKVLAEELEAAGLRPRVLTATPEEGGVYRALLPQYAATGQLVVWAGRLLDEDAQEAVRDFLARGGRLLLVSLELPYSPRGDLFTEQVLGARIVPLEEGWRWWSPISSLVGGQVRPFRTRHVPLRVQAPAEPILRNGAGHDTGLRRQTGSGRLVFLPFYLLSFPDSDLRALTRESIDYLEGGAALPPEVMVRPALSAARALENYPNPFNAATTVRFSLAESGPAEVAIYNVAGQLVRQLLAGPLPAGDHAVAWDGRDAVGRETSSGVYLCRLQTAQGGQSRRLLLVR